MALIISPIPSNLSQTSFWLQRLLFFLLTFTCVQWGLACTSCIPWSWSFSQLWTTWSRHRELNLGLLQDQQVPFSEPRPPPSFLWASLSLICMRNLLFRIYRCRASSLGTVQPSLQTWCSGMVIVTMLAHLYISWFYLLCFQMNGISLHSQVSY